MRLTVLLCDALVCIPACLEWGRLVKGALRGNHRSSLFVTLALLFSPAAILIDHGHFQYNCVALGCFVIFANQAVFGT